MQQFHPLVREWFLSRFPGPTRLQEEAWKIIASGQNALITAPTGRGKTLAAFLWALDRLISGSLETGATRILYISPLRALNNDVHRNLLQPLEELQLIFSENKIPFPAISVMTRSGDTPQNERQRMLRKPPEILITTPESCNILLSSQRGIRLFDNLQTVILDEIHAIVRDKRGTLLMSAIERIRMEAGPLQRIALSATVQPAERIAAFVAGYDFDGEEGKPRPINIVRDREPGTRNLDVFFPESPETGPGSSVYPALVKQLKEIIRENNATLIFTNSRRVAERLTRMINDEEPEPLAWAHHGSLSREIRHAVEKRLKCGELRAIVATSSLELGIDIGSLDRVLMVQTPPGMASTMQRLGRSNHRVGGTSRGTLFPLHGMDLISAVVTAETVREGKTETLHPVNAPLDVLAQILVSMGLHGPMPAEDAYRILRSSWPYRRLKRETFDRVMEMLAGRYSDSSIRELKAKIFLDRLNGTFKTRPEAGYVLFSSGGTIPDRGYFTLREQGSNRKIGELDEEFVWERRIGEVFTLGTKTWLIEEITHNDVIVSRDSTARGMVPFWKAEDAARDPLLSERIGLFLQELDSIPSTEETILCLEKRRNLDHDTARILALYLQKQKDRSGRLPGRDLLLVEHFNDPLNRTDNKQVILHTLWGIPRNRPFAFALASAWEKRYGFPLTTWVNNNCVLLLLPAAFKTGELFDLLEPESLHLQLQTALEKSGYFGSRFRENAARALLLPKRGFRRRQPLWLNRLRAKKLIAAVSGYSDFPITRETWRECLQDFDMDGLKERLEEIRDGRIQIHECFTTTPSPFAADLIWRQTNHHMYQDDTPAGSGGQRLKSGLIAELAADNRLRPAIPGEAAAILDERLTRTAPGYAPEDPDDLVAFVSEQLILQEEQWDALKGIIREKSSAVDKAAGRLLKMSIPPAGTEVICTAECYPRIKTFFGEPVQITHPGSETPPSSSLLKKMERIEPDPDDTPADFLYQLLEGRALFPETELKGLFPASFPLEKTLVELTSAGRIIVDRIIADTEVIQICTADNMETMLRIARRLRRPEFQPLPAASMPLFQATWQGLIEEEGSPLQLQDKMEQLLGYPAPAALWEEAIIPCRFPMFRTEWMDRLFSTDGLRWKGTGTKRCALLFPEDARLFFGRMSASALRDQAGDLFPAETGKYSFEELNSAGRTSAELSETLWRMSWEGITGNDSMEVVRKGILSGFKPAVIKNQTPGRGTFSRWKSSRAAAGSWFLWKEEPDNPDAFLEEMQRRERVRQLLARYGILCRELLTAEQPLLRWGALFRTLRLMELSGEIASGLFFEEYSSPQFISFSAWGILQRGLNGEAVWFCNAMDPASPAASCPDSLRPGLPRRIAGNWLVYQGDRLAAAVEKNGSRINLPSGDLRDISLCKPLFEMLLYRDFNPLKEIRLLEINGEQPDSKWDTQLRELGFIKRGGHPELRKKY